MKIDSEPGPGSFFPSEEPPRPLDQPLDQSQQDDIPGFEDDDDFDLDDLPTPVFTA